MTDTTFPTTQDFVAIGFNGSKAKSWDSVCAWLKNFCDGLPKDARLTTRELLERTGVDADKAAVQALWRIRKDGGVPEGYWERDPTKRWMGNQLIIWRKPSAVDVSIF